MIKKHICDPERFGTEDNGQPLSPKVVTCGRCNRSWCERCDPCPSALCPFCNSNGSSARIGAKQLKAIEQQKAANSFPYSYKRTEHEYQVIDQSGTIYTGDNLAIAEKTFDDTFNKYHKHIILVSDAGILKIRPLVH